MTAPDAHHAALRSALRQVGSVLKAAGHPFALCGGYALWVWGAPEPDHDVDYMIAEADVESVAQALVNAGCEVDRPVEDWLLKVWVQGELVDILHRRGGAPVLAAHLAELDSFEVLGIRLPVLAVTDLLSMKLGSLTEHYCDFAPLLPAARAVREQADWARLAADVADNPFARAFLFLLEELGIASREHTEKEYRPDPAKGLP